MTKKRRRKPEHEYRYDVAITSWDARVVFNEYAYFNLFDCAPFTERYYIVLNGTVGMTTSKKIKKGMAAEVVLHPTTAWDKVDGAESEQPIGDLLIENNPKSLLARISIPMRSYELIRSYMTHAAQGRIELVGTEINKRAAEIFYIGFNSKPYEASNEDDA